MLTFDNNNLAVRDSSTVTFRLRWEYASCAGAPSGHVFPVWADPMFRIPVRVALLAAMCLLSAGAFAQPHRRESIDSRPADTSSRVGPQGDPAAAFSTMRGRMTPLERQRLRADISDAGRSIYGDYAAGPRRLLIQGAGNH